MEEYPTTFINENKQDLIDDDDILKENEEKILIKHCNSVNKLFSRIIKDQDKRKHVEAAPFQMWEQNKVIRNLKLKKYPGVDSLNNELFMHSVIEFKKSMLKIINSVHDEN